MLQVGVNFVAHDLPRLQLASCLHKMKKVAFSYMPEQKHLHGFIGLGSNMGDPQNNIAQALKAVDAFPDLSVDAVSPMFWTEPQGLLEQNWFVNCVARIRVDASLSPQDLLAILAGIETSMGRERSVRWGPRIIDIDILLLGEIRMDNEILCIPHPRMLERAFVLVPLQCLAPDLCVQGRTPEQWLAKLRYVVENDRIRQTS